jgi:hypothetical protein
LTVEGIQRDIIAVKEYASDLQTFLGSKAIEEEVKKEEKYIMALSEDGCLQQLNLKCSINEKINDTMSTMSSFGSVSIETIICACLAFIVLITTDGELVSIETDPNDDIVDIVSFIFSLMLHFRLRITNLLYIIHLIFRKERLRSV